MVAGEYVTGLAVHVATGIVVTAVDRSPLGTAAASSDGSETVTSYLRGHNMMTGVLLWEHFSWNDATLDTECGAIAARKEGEDSTSGPVLLSVVTGEALVEDAQRNCSSAFKYGLPSACAGSSWVVQSAASILTSDRRGKLTLLSGDGSLAWSREEGLAHPISAGFFELDDHGGRVLVVLSTFAGVYGLDVQSGGALLWQVNAAGGDTAKEASVQLRPYLVRGHARFAFVVVVADNVDTTVRTIDAASGVVKDTAVLGGFAAAQASLLPDGSACVQLLDEAGVELRAGFACSAIDATGPSQPAFSWFSAPRGSASVLGRKAGSSAWEAGVPFDGRVLAIATTRPHDAFEHQSNTAPVRVTGERKLLFKYMNPSVALVLSKNSEDPSAQYLSGITANLVDTKTGSILDAVRHPGATAPVAAVRCDNWFVYTFWNADLLEQEVHVVDMYESVARPPWMRTAFSLYMSELARSLLPSMAAFDALFAPGSDNTVQAVCAAGSGVVDGDDRRGTCATSTSTASSWPPVSLAPPTLARSSYVMTHAVTSLGVTVSERGATDRGVIMGLSSGRVVQFPRMVLDPRRPNHNSAEAANEMLFPYKPSLAVWPTQSLSRLYAVSGHAVPGLLPDGGLETSPMQGRESTCHFVALGMDIAYSTLAPAGKFDTLADDFDYVAVSGSIAALAFAVIATRRAAKRRLLEDLWVR